MHEPAVSRGRGRLPPPPPAKATAATVNPLAAADSVVAREPPHDVAGRDDEVDQMTDSSNNTPREADKSRKDGKKKKRTSVLFDIPKEIEKGSVITYLKKDVSKTQLYRSLPVYMLVLLLISIGLALQTMDDPVHFWANQHAKDTLLVEAQDFRKVNSYAKFWAWAQSIVLDKNTGLGPDTSEVSTLQVTSFSTLRQYRGEVYNCRESDELSAISPHRQTSIPAVCLRRYGPSDTTAYGPLGPDGTRVFKPDYTQNELRLSSLKVTGMKCPTPPSPIFSRTGEVNDYSDCEDSFSVRLPHGSLGEGVQAELLAEKMEAVRSENFVAAQAITAKLQHVAGSKLLQECGVLSSNDEAGCMQIPGCTWRATGGGLCVAKTASCYSVASATECSTRSELCTWRSTGCFPDCARMATEGVCLVSGCYWSKANPVNATATGSCVDPRPDALSVLQGLENNNWIDMQTRAVMLEQLLYNPHSRHFVLVNYFIEILPVGVWLPQITTSQTRIFALSSHKKKAMFALDVIVSIYIAWSIVAFFLSWQQSMEMAKVNAHCEGVDTRTGLQRARDTLQSWLNGITFYIAFELGFTVLFTTAYVLKWILWAYGIDMVNRSDIRYLPPEIADTIVWNDLVDYIRIVNREKIVYATAVIFAWLRLFSYVQYNDRLNSLTETIKVAFGSLISLLIIFLVIFIGFMFAGNLAFGADLQEFNSLMRSSGYMSRLLFSAELADYAQFRAIEPIWSIIYFGLFFCLAWLVLLNMVLAIITSSFNVVKQNSLGENGEGKAPSWKPRALVRDMRKFFKRITKRSDIAGIAHIKSGGSKYYEYYDENGRRCIGKMDDTGEPDSPESIAAGKREKIQKAGEFVKGSYVVNRIKAIQILDYKEQDPESELPPPSDDKDAKPANGTSEDGATEVGEEFITLAELKQRLSHLSSAEVRKIFHKACHETSYGSRAQRRGERVARLINEKVSAVEVSLAEQRQETACHGEILNQTVADLDVLLKDADAIKEELGNGCIDDVHRATLNIDANVYALPAQFADTTKHLLGAARLDQRSPQPQPPPIEQHAAAAPPANQHLPLPHLSPHALSQVVRTTLGSPTEHRRRNGSPRPSPLPPIDPPRVAPSPPFLSANPLDDLSPRKPAFAPEYKPLRHSPVPASAPATAPVSAFPLPTPPSPAPAPAPASTPTTPAPPAPAVTGAPKKPPSQPQPSAPPPNVAASPRDPPLSHPDPPPPSEQSEPVRKPGDAE